MTRNVQPVCTGPCLIRTGVRVGTSGRGAVARAARASRDRGGHASCDGVPSSCSTGSRSTQERPRADACGPPVPTCRERRHPTRRGRPARPRGAPPRDARAAHRRVARSGRPAGRARGRRPRRRRRATPLAPCSATKLASASVELPLVGEVPRVQEVVAVEEVERRLRHDAACARLVEQQRGSDADVQRLDRVRRAGSRSRRRSPADERAHALALGAEDEHGAAREVGLPERPARPSPPRHRPRARGPFTSFSQRARFVTTAIGRCSTAPAEARQTAGVTRAEPCAGTTTPVAPAPSALRADRAEVARVGHLVERDDQRALAGDELVGVGVRIGLAPGERRPGGRGCRRPRVSSRSGFTCSRGPSRSQGSAAAARSRRPELEHLAAAAQRLADGAPAVDLLARHARGTSR